MKRIIKNIIRLPGAFLPLFLSAVLAVVLILLCFSVTRSCDEALERIENSYDATLTLTVKKKYDHVLTDKGKYLLMDVNTALIDLDILDIIKAENRLTISEYTTNPYLFQLELIRTDKQLSGIEAEVASGKPFHTAPSRLILPHRTVWNISSVGCTDESQLPIALGKASADISVTYRDGMSYGDGVLLSKEIYDFLESPENIVIGWYAVKTSGISNHFSVVDGKYQISNDILDLALKQKDGQSEPRTSVPVAGYFSAEMMESRIICPPELWETVYRAQDYYQSNSNALNKYRDNISAIDEVGIVQLKMALDSPADAPDVIRSLIDSGIGAEDYLIEADDYDYKFAVSQINGIRGFASGIFLLSVIFGIAATVLLVLYSVKRRHSETYTLRTLGKNEGGIALSVCFEISLVLLAAILTGIALGYVFGSGICARINDAAYRSTVSTAENMSRVAELMQNSESVKAQLEGAVGRYLQTDTSIRFIMPWQLICLLFISWLGLSGCALLSSWAAVGGSLMKKEK